MRDTITLSVAILGAVLGVLNFLRSVSRDGVRLKVIPKFWMNDIEQGVLIEVINLGFYAVTITEVGIDLEGDRRLALHHCYSGNTSLPMRLEPRASLTMLAGNETDKNLPLIRSSKAFARTACGLNIKGTSPFLKATIKNSTRPSENK